jgi:hypothetical protein
MCVWSAFLPDVFTCAVQSNAGDPPLPLTVRESCLLQSGSATYLASSLRIHVTRLAGTDSNTVPGVWWWRCLVQVVTFPCSRWLSVEGQLKVDLQPGHAAGLTR